MREKKSSNNHTQKYTHRHRFAAKWKAVEGVVVVEVKEGGGGSAPVHLWQLRESTIDTGNTFVIPVGEIVIPS